MAVRSRSGTWSVLAFVLAAACAGCATSDNPPPVMTPAPIPPPSPPPPGQNFNTPEFQAIPALNQISALGAYQAGGNGAGVIVSVIDSGIDVNNPEFAGRIHPQSADLIRLGIVPISELRPDGPNLQDIDGHGTSVAGIIGAAKNDSGMHGVAFNTTLLIFRVDTESDPNAIDGNAVAEGIIRSANNNAAVMNFSFGSDEPGARDEFRSIFDFTSVNDIVVAIAAGNDTMNDPDESALAAMDPEAGGAVIIVGAVTSQNVIAPFSNRAGVAAQYYMVAPGVNIPTPNIGGGLAFFSGTSASTPFVAGAAAIIRQLWPLLTAAEVVQILFDSATDLGAAGVDAIYGHGLLNLAAALAPLGGTSTLSVSGATLSLDAPVLEIGPAFGGSLPDLGDFIFLDKYGRDFRASLNGLARTRADLSADPIALLNPHRAYASDSFSLANGAMRLRIAGEDRAFMSAAAALRAPAAAWSRDEASLDQSIAFAFSQPLNETIDYMVAYGFSPREVDGFLSNAAPMRVIARDGFSDAYLLEREALAATAGRWRIDELTTLDIVGSYGRTSQAVYESDLWTLRDPGEGIRQINIRAGLSRRLPGGEVRLEAGFRQEEDGVLGAGIGGAFGESVGAMTYYQAGAFDLALADGWRARARAAIGLTSSSANGANGFFAGVDDLVSTQFALGAYKDGAFWCGDRLLFALSQPLRIESGAMRLIVPAQFDVATEALVFAERRIGLGEAPRQWDIEAGYAFVTAFGAVIEANVLRQMNIAANGQAATTGILRATFGF